MKWRGWGLVKVVGVVLLVGWLPLIVSIVFDWPRGRGGNPIGLGLLMVACTVIAVLLLIGQGLLTVYDQIFGAKR